MLRRPSIGQAVLVWYATKPKRRGGVVPAEFMPHHGKTGIVRIRPEGKGPKNFGIEIDGKITVIPAGNLNKID